MKNYKKAMIPLIAVSALTLAACSSGDSASPDVTSESAAEMQDSMDVSDDMSDMDTDMDMEMDMDMGTEPHGHMLGDGTTDSVPGYSLAFNEYDPENSKLTFSIANDDGEVVTDFKIKHEKPLHMILASENLGEYHHVHPEMSEDGFWTVDFPRVSGGTWAAYTDFTTEEAPDGVVLRTNLDFTGEVTPFDLPEPSALIEQDGFVITAVSDMSADKHGSLTLTVLRDGAPVEFDKYLGEDAHLVALRSEDGAYAHFHPMNHSHSHSDDGSMDSSDHSEMTAPGVLMFETEVPGPGTYLLFLEFIVDGTLYEVPFTADIV